MALKSFRDRSPVMVGLISLTVLSLAVVVAFLTGTMGLLEGGYAMSGVFSDTGGMRTGDAVRVAGVRVGEVTEIKPDFERTRIIITWKVDSAVKLGPQTRAEIKVANVLGGRYLRLAGPVGAPYMDDVPPRRRRIPPERTGVPVTVNEALKQATGVVSGLDTKAVDHVLSQLKGISQRGRGRAGNALAKLVKLNETINQANPELNQLLSNIERVNQLVTSKDRQLSQLLTQVQSLLGQLSERRVELSAVLGSGSTAVRSITHLIDKQQDELIAITTDLQATMQALGTPNAGFNSTLAWVGPTLNGISGIGGYGPWQEVAVTGLGPFGPDDIARLLPKRPGQPQKRTPEGGR